ncbi:MAG: HlyD family type I secretion periplasmic adaptor subunit [Pseudomonadota bacterium]
MSQHMNTSSDILSAKEPLWSEKRIIRNGLFVVLFFIGGLVFWGLTTEIDSAVIATGKVIVEARPQTLQHDDGGLVKRLYKREGETVQAGEVVLQFDDESFLSIRESLERQLYLNTLSLARVKQELVEKDAFVLPVIEFDHELSEVYIAEIAQQQSDLYHENKRHHKQSLQQIRNGLREARYELVARRKQKAAIQRQVDLAQEELKSVKKLEGQNISSKSHRRDVETGHASLLSDLYELSAEINQARAKITQLTTQQNTYQAERRVKLLRELAELEDKANKLSEDHSTIKVKLERTLVRAPMAGVIADMKTYTEGGYVPPGYVIATVIPQDSPFVIQGHILPHEIDRVIFDQEVTISLPNFNAKITPKFTGRINKISAISIIDEQLQTEHYPVEVFFDIDLVPKILRERFISGLPVELYINTGSRPPLYYLFKPFVDFFDRSLREE